MIKTKKVKKSVIVTTDVTCDSCGKSCKVYLDRKKTSFNFEFMTLDAHWGYGSGKDMERQQAQVCEKCVDKKLSPIIKFRKTDMHFTTMIDSGAEEARVANALPHGSGGLNVSIHKK
jgi:hypothetical protein